MNYARLISGSGPNQHSWTSFSVGVDGVDLLLDQTLHFISFILMGCAWSCVNNLTQFLSSFVKSPDDESEPRLTIELRKN